MFHDRKHTFCPRELLSETQMEIVTIEKRVIYSKTMERANEIYLYNNYHFQCKFATCK